MGLLLGLVEGYLLGEIKGESCLLGLLLSNLDACLLDGIDGIIEG